MSKVARPEQGAPVVKQIRGAAADVRQKVLDGRKPNMNIPVRSLGNVTYKAKDGFFRLKGAMMERTLTVNTVKTFAQTLRMMALAKMHIETLKHSSKREAYYISKNWGDARFNDQPESDAIMDDVEAMLRVNREQIHFRADEHGGSVAGELVVIDKDRKTGKRLEIDCSRFGSGSYTVPSVVEHLEFRTKAKFVLCIETNGTFERLVEESYFQTANCVLVAMGGVPSRACRRFVRLLADTHDLPVYVFTDGDPYGYFNIYRTLKVGSGNAAHLNEFFCVPQARYLGVTPYDVETFDLKDCTHPLEPVDIKRAQDALRNDPFVIHHKEWQDAIAVMLKMGKRVEQQAFAKHGLEYVVTKYLPAKLKHTEKFLP
jgi:DNA topoisomerase-6 subunit A